MPKRRPEPSRSPQDFASVLATGTPLLLVGGQAVNLWALYYERRTADLAPFVSRDVDVLGDRNTLTMLAETTGAEPQFFPLRPPTNEVGVILAADGHGGHLPIEVLRHVHGISNEELCDPIYTVAIPDSRAQVRLPGPVALMQAKIANLADLVQTERQDARHVLILARLMPAYLADLEAAVARGRMEERSFVDLLERLLLTVTAPKARRILNGIGVEPRILFAELQPASQPKVSAFLKKRLPRTLKN